MNNYFINQMRRANCGLATKVKMYVYTLTHPGEMRRMWNNHSIELQNQLNGEHEHYRGWWVDRRSHEVCYDRSRWTKDGLGMYWPLPE